MNTPYVVFDLTSGAPLRWGQCQIEMLEAQAGPGERALATSDLSVDGNRAIIRQGVKSLRDAHLLAGAPTEFGRVNVDPVSTGKITGIAVRALVAQQRGDVAFQRTITFYDDSELILTADQLIELGVQTESFVNACHDRARYFVAQINNAADMAELLSIDVTAGWPSLETED